MSILHRSAFIIKNKSVDMKVKDLLTSSIGLVGQVTTESIKIAGVIGGYATEEIGKILKDLKVGVNLVSGGEKFNIGGINQDSMKPIIKSLESISKTLRHSLPSTFLHTSSTKAIFQSEIITNGINIINDTFKVLRLPLKLSGPSSQDSRLDIECRILAHLRKIKACDKSTSSLSDPVSLIKYLRDMDIETRQVLGKYVDSLIDTGIINSLPFVPHAFEKKLYVDILSVIMFSFESGLKSLGSIDLWGHFLKVSNVRTPEALASLDRHISTGSSHIGNEQLSLIVDIMLKDDFVNNPLIPDSIESGIYLNAMVVLFRLLEDFSKTTDIKVMGHSIQWSLQPLSLDQIRNSPQAAHCKLNQDVIEEVVNEMLLDSDINIIWIPDVIEAAIYRNCFLLMLRVMEQGLSKVQLRFLGTEWSFNLVNGLDADSGKCVPSPPTSLDEVDIEELESILHEMKEQVDLITRNLNKKKKIKDSSTTTNTYNDDLLFISSLPASTPEFGFVSTDPLTRTLRLTRTTPIPIHITHHVATDILAYPLWMPWCSESVVVDEGGKDIILGNDYNNLTDNDDEIIPTSRFYETDKRKMFRCRVGFGIDMGAMFGRIGDDVKYVVETQRPENVHDENIDNHTDEYNDHAHTSSTPTPNTTTPIPTTTTARCIARSHPSSFSDQMIYDWRFTSTPNGSTIIIVDVLFKAKSFLLINMWEILQKSLTDEMIDAFVNRSENVLKMYRDEK